MSFRFCIVCVLIYGILFQGGLQMLYTACTWLFAERGATAMQLYAVLYLSTLAWYLRTVLREFIAFCNLGAEADGSGYLAAGFVGGCVWTVIGSPLVVYNTTLCQ